MISKSSFSNLIDDGETVDFIFGNSNQKTYSDLIDFLVKNDSIEEAKKLIQYYGFDASQNRKIDSTFKGNLICAGDVVIEGKTLAMLKTVVIGGMLITNTYIEADSISVGSSIEAEDIKCVGILKTESDILAQRRIKAHSIIGNNIHARESIEAVHTIKAKNNLTSPLIKAGWFYKVGGIIRQVAYPENEVTK